MNTYPLDIVAVDVYLLTLTAGKKKNENTCEKGGLNFSNAVLGENKMWPK